MEAAMEEETAAGIGQLSEPEKSIAVVVPVAEPERPVWITLAEAVERFGLPMARLRKAVREKELASEYSGKAMCVPLEAVADLVRQAGPLPAIIEIRLLPEEEYRERRCLWSGGTESEAAFIEMLRQGMTRDEIAAGNSPLIPPVSAEEIVEMAERFWRETA